MVVDFELKKFCLGNFTKIFFQSSLELILLNWGLAEECVSVNRFCRTKVFDLVVLRKSTSVVVDFELKKYSLGNLTKSFFFQSSLGLILLNWGLAEECIPANRYCRTEIFDLVVLRKKYFGGCWLRAQKILFRQFNEKFFPI